MRCFLRLTVVNWRRRFLIYIYRGIRLHESFSGLARSKGEGFENLPWILRWMECTSIRFSFKGKMKKLSIDGISKWTQRECIANRFIPLWEEDCYSFWNKGPRWKKIFLIGVGKKFFTKRKKKEDYLFNETLTVKTFFFL